MLAVLGRYYYGKAGNAYLTWLPSITLVEQSPIVNAVKPSISRPPVSWHLSELNANYSNRTVFSKCMNEV